MWQGEKKELDMDSFTLGLVFGVPVFFLLEWLFNLISKIFY